MILVTGGTGMVGKHLQEILPNAVYVGSDEYDLTDWFDTVALFENHRPKRVIHLAAKVGGIIDNVNKPAEYFDDNVMMNHNIITMCRKYKVSRFTAMLSTCIYPDKVDRYPMTEDDLFVGPPAPTNFSYAYAKRCMAVQIGAYNKQYGTEYNYLTSCNLYSEHDNFDHGNKMHFITALLKKIKNSNESIELLGTGKPLRQFMYAGDLARVIKEVIDKDITESFNVATETNYSINEMAEIAVEELKSGLKIEYPDNSLDGQYRKDVSIDKLKQLLPGFKFTNYKDGISRVYNGIK